MANPIYLGTRCKGYVLDSPAWIVKCPACEFERATGSKESADACFLTHCRTAGGKPHDKLIVDHHFGEVFNG